MHSATQEIQASAAADERQPRPAEVIYHGKAYQNRGDRVFMLVLKFAAFMPLLLMLAFIAVLIHGSWDSIQHFGVKFLFTNDWDPSEDAEIYGALPSVYGTLFSSICALALAGPVGIGVAAFLNEVVPPGPRAVITFLIEILATIPSIVYGVWAFFVLVPFISNPDYGIQTILQQWIPHGSEFILFSGPPLGLGLLAATLVLAVMILPLIVSLSLDAIRSVPASYREAAMGLGSTKWETIRIAVLPPAKSGLIGACILALGRALGETMAVTMVIGNSNMIRWALFQPATTISSMIANNFGEAFGLMQSALIELALILFGMTMLVNLIARYLVLKFATVKVAL